MTDRLRARAYEWRWIALPLLAGIAAWGPSLRGEFVWDDWVFLQRWTLGATTIRGIFLPDLSLMNGMPYYKPTWMALSYLLLHVFARHAWGWRLAGLLLHLGTAAGVAVPAERFLRPGPGRRRLAVAAATIFAVWPALSEGLGWSSARGDLLIALFSVWGLVSHLRARDAGRRPIAAALLFFAAILSKETAIAFLPISVAASLLLPAEEGATAPDPVRGSMRWQLWLPYALGFLLYNLLRQRALGTHGSLGTLATGLLGAKALVPGFYAWGYYVRESLLLGAGAPYFEYVHWGKAYVACALAGFVLVAAALLAARRPAGRPWTVAMVWFVCFIGPAVAVAGSPNSITPVAMRYLYAPCAALALAGALLLERCPSWESLARPARWRAAGAATFAIVAAIAMDQFRIAPWLSDAALWNRALVDEPRSMLVWGNLGNLAARKNRSLEAEDDFRIAAWSAIPVGDAQKVQALARLARFYLSRQKFDMARVALLEATRFSGSADEISSNMTTASVLELLMTRGADQKSLIPREKLRQQIAALEEASDIDPYNQTSAIALGIVLESVEEPVRARHYYKEFLRVNVERDSMEEAARQRIKRLDEKIEAETDPLKRAYYRAETLQEDGKIDGALAAYREASALAPDRVDILGPLANLEAVTGNIPRAEEHMLHATTVAPQDPALWLNLGVYRAGQKKYREAAEAFEKAQSIAPSWPKPYIDAGRAWDLAGDRQRAAQNYAAFLARFHGDLQTATAVRDRLDELSAGR